MVDTFEISAQRGRSRALFLYTYKTKSLTDANAAAILTNNAIKLGLIPPRQSVPGKNLISWSKDRTGKNVTVWAAFSAIDLLTQYMHWYPETADELAIWAVSLVRQYPLLTKPAAFQKLIPEKTDYKSAQESLQQALKLSAPYAKPLGQSKLYSLPENAPLVDRAIAAVQDRQKPMTSREMSVTLLYQHSPETEDLIIDICRESPGLYVTRKDLEGNIIELQDDVDESTVFISEC